MSFGGDVSAYAKKTGLTIDNAVVAICSEATRRIITKTPVDTGRARGNWFASINDVHGGTDEGRREGDAIIQGVSLAQKAGGKVFNLTNNLPYINKLEHGYSGQAPAGMVRVTAVEIDKQLKDFAK